MSEWGPWIEHDGGSADHVYRSGARRINLVYGEHGAPPPNPLPLNWPGWLWRWKRVRTGWFGSYLRPVCDDPAYAPIVRYRLHRPQALRDLIRIAENPSEMEDA